MKKRILTLHKKDTQKGISLVISLIMMALLLSISLSTGNIILRQLRLTNIGTNSQTSFYAADSALECALYWDTKTDGTLDNGTGEGAYFGTSTLGAWVPGTNPIRCGIVLTDPMGFTKVVDNQSGTATTSFFVDYGPKTCARVEVVKNSFRTKISTTGYNVGPNSAHTGCDLDDAIANRTVERGLVFTH